MGYSLRCLRFCLGVCVRMFKKIIRKKIYRRDYLRICMGSWLRKQRMQIATIMT